MQALLCRGTKGYYHHFIFAPFHSFLYGLTLLFTRIYAAVTLGDDGWDTRVVPEEEIEVEIVRSAA